MLCHWIKHLKSHQGYCKLKFNFRSNYFGHNSHRHLKINITPHINPQHTQADTCAPPTPHKHSKYHHNMNTCTLLSTYHTFTLDFLQKQKTKSSSSSSLLCSERKWDRKRYQWAVEWTAYQWTMNGKEGAVNSEEPLVKFWDFRFFLFFFKD